MGGKQGKKLQIEPQPQLIKETKSTFAIVAKLNLNLNLNPTNMDKTFAETQDQPPFDWRQWLLKAIDYTPRSADYDEKLTLAKSWVTCACGNLCAIIPRERGTSGGTDGRPIDETLSDLGIRFFGAIADLNFERALKTLDAIEKQAENLIQIELKKRNEL